MSFLVSALLTVIFIIQTNLPLTEGIQCYRCTIVPPPAYFNDTRRLCSEFNYSDHYIVDCPYSTFCMTKSYTIDFGLQVVNGTSRNCAPQMNIFQDYEDGRWQKKIIIEEPYTEGCSDTNYDKDQRLSKTTYCYCRGNLCNSSARKYINVITVICTCIIFMLLDVIR